MKDRIQRHLAFGAIVTSCAFAAGPAAAGPAGGLTGDQQRQALQRVVLVCENDHTIPCPSDPDNPDYFINGFQFDRIFHASCDAGFNQACVPLIVAERPATLSVAATELPPDPTAACIGDPDCLNLEAVIGLEVPGIGGSLALERSFVHPSGFLRQFACQGDNDSAGVRISDWFPFRDLDCLFDDGINFEGMLLATNVPQHFPDGAATNVDPRLDDFEAALVHFAEDELGIPAGSVLPTTMIDAADPARGLLAGNAVKLRRVDLVDEQIVNGTRSGRYPVTVRYAVAQRSAAEEVQKLTASVPGANDEFGRAVAIAGGVAVVGAPSEEVGGTAGPGAVYVFRSDGLRWSEEARLTASDGADFDRFGAAVAISADAIAIGAPGAAGGRGAAYVFRFDDGGWSEEDRLAASDAADSDSFGAAIAIDGSVALVGVPLHEGTVGIDRGAAYVFDFDAGSWAERQRITASDGANSDGFGGAVALAGPSAVVGAAQANTSAGVGAGAAYVFRLAGSSFAQQTKLAPTGAAGGDAFGSAVAASGDALLIGAPGAIGTPLLGTRSGAAVVFRGTTSCCTQEARLFPSDGQDFDGFGGSVALNGDAALVGAASGGGNTSPESGSAYLFRRHGGGGWLAERELVASDGVSFDTVGTAVALDREAMLVAGPLASNGADFGDGAVWVFERPRTTLIVEGTAQGGVVRAVVRGVTAEVVTAPGQSADAIAADLAAALGANAKLGTLAVSAMTDAGRIALVGANSDDVAVTTTDAGLTTFQGTACSNGADDDGDGFVDVDDPGCAGANDPSERSPLFACDNGVDDDSDGLADQDDPGCPFPVSRPENPSCDDGLDNDGDGFTDFDDPSCERAWPFWESTPMCGLGAEIPFLLIALQLIRRRGRE